MNFDYYKEDGVNRFIGFSCDGWRVQYWMKDGETVEEMWGLAHEKYREVCDKFGIS